MGVAGCGRGAMSSFITAKHYWLQFSILEILSCQSVMNSCSIVILLHGIYALGGASHLRAVRLEAAHLQYNSSFNLSPSKYCQRKIKLLTISITKYYTVLFCLLT